MALGELQDDYLAWNRAIVEVIFGGDHANEPVYLDLEDEVLTEVARHAAPGAKDPTEALVQAVRPTLYLDPGGIDPVSWTSPERRI
jgi:hypothetical protein